MMANLKSMWAERSPREQWMLGVMFALLAIVLLWFGVVWPVDAARVSARTRLADATERHAAIVRRVDMLKKLPSGANDTQAMPLDQYMGQSTAEAGFALERAQAQGDDRIDIAMASVRPIALFSWLATLEGQGIRVETLTARPAPTAGSISVQAVLVRSDGR